MSHHKDTEYLGISARIHAMENRLLNRERMERMIDAKDDADAAKVLSECGYGELTQVSAAGLEQMLTTARAQTAKELSGAVPDKRLVEIFQIKYDYHNAKVIIKAEAKGVEAKALLLPGGRYAPDAMLDAYRRDEPWGATPIFRDAMTQAKETLAATGDPQLADFQLDRAYYKEMAQLAQQVDSAFLQGYVRLAVDIANLRSVVRAVRLEKNTDFLKLTLIPGGNVAEQSIIGNRAEEITAPYQTGLLTQAATAAKPLLHPNGGSLTEFERLCDDAMTAYLEQARRVPFGEEPVIGYLYARELEITTIRTIMSGRMAKLDGETIRSRLRMAYI